MNTQNNTTNEKIVKTFLVATIVPSVAAAVSKVAHYWNDKDDFFK